MIPDSKMPGLYIIGSRVVDSVFQLRETSITIGRSFKWQLFSFSLYTSSTPFL